MTDTILEVKDMKKYFNSPKGKVHAVDGVSFSIERGSTLGIVGESGCGKSTIGKSILRLTEPSDGQVFFEGKDITEISKREMRRLRKDMQIVFQDPYSSLNPRKTVSQAIREPIVINNIIKGKDAINDRVVELMEMVGLDQRLYNTYPHELDGGRRQRICIARALAVEPKFILCDEPVSALDVSIQAQILNLMKDLQEQLGLTYIFITHDLSVVKFFSDRIIVMYLGKVVETASADDLFKNPVHPYTQALLSSIPVPDLEARKERIMLSGEISSPINPKNECRFAKRCRFVMDVCHESAPDLTEISEGHCVACHLLKTK
ncbi:MAG: ABC transporter ATP-binding protein [Spirochaetales bacterium]|nr:ABC transporter ATP-binding protein [Spirochaetales bacterium]